MSSECKIKFDFESLKLNINFTCDLSIIIKANSVNNEIIKKNFIVDSKTHEGEIN